MCTLPKEKERFFFNLKGDCDALPLGEKLPFLIEAVTIQLHSVRPLVEPYSEQAQPYLVPPLPAPPCPSHMLTELDDESAFVLRL